LKPSIEPHATAGRWSRRLPLFSLFAANTISFVGNVLTALAIPWFVLQTTGSVAQTGLTAFFSTLPLVLSAFFSSALVDRLGYQRTSVLGDLASGLTVALVPFLTQTVGLAFWQLLVLVFLGGLLKAPGSTARSALFRN
jgi:MFS family permease